MEVIEYRSFDYSFAKIVYVYRRDEVDNSGVSGIISEKRYNKNHDSKGRFASNSSVSLKMSKAEIKKVSSEISTNYRKYAGKKKCLHYTLWHDEYFAYYFINNGFADYTFTKKVRS